VTHSTTFGGVQYRHRFKVGDVIRVNDPDCPPQRVVALYAMHTGEVGYQLDPDGRIPLAIVDTKAELVTLEAQ
jgi:hypothetical protein